MSADTLISGVPEVELTVRASGSPKGLQAALVTRGPGPHSDLDAALTGKDVRLDSDACWGDDSAANQGCFPGNGLDRPAGDLDDIVAVGAHGIGRASWSEPYVDPGDEWVTIRLPLGRVHTVVPAGDQFSLVLMIDDPIRLGSGEGRTVEIRSGRLLLPLGTA